MKTYTIDQVQDALIGKKGTARREKFEYELQMDIIGSAIKQSRRERNLTQEQLGKLIGVQKSQISRLESNVGNVTLDTLMKVFAALKAKVKLQIELTWSYKCITIFMLLETTILDFSDTCNFSLIKDTYY